MPYRLELPTLQNWNCHNCSGCCRQHEIEITEAERLRIIEQHWERDPAIGPATPVFARLGGWPGRRRYRLAHRADGACVFLDERGLCRIHAAHGEAAKPLACRVYPYAFHPAGKQVVVSLRFSCPSVVGNRGAAISTQRDELKSLAKLVVPEDVSHIPPPPVAPGKRVEWDDLLRLVSGLVDIFADVSIPFGLRLLRGLYVARLIELAQFGKVTGERLSELMQILSGAAVAEVAGNPGIVAPPSAPALVQFRLLVAQYARKDTHSVGRGGWLGRWRLLRSAWRFAKGRGTAPALQNVFREVPFESIETDFGPPPEGADELFARHAIVKLQGLHFCGRGYYDLPLVEGFRSLALFYPAVMWLARWLAVGDGRTTLSFEDVTRAMAIADHHHGFSPAFGTYGFRRRVRLLTATGDLERLCVRYCGAIGKG